MARPGPHQPDPTPDQLRLAGEFRALAERIDEHRREMRRCGERRRQILRTLHAQGLGYGTIAKACGVSRGLVQNALRYPG